MTLSFIPKLAALVAALLIFGDADRLVGNVHHHLRYDPANLHTMNLILDDVVQILATGLIPLLRISALLLAAPLVSLKVVSVRIRVAIALVLTVFIYPMLELPVIDPVSARGLMLIIREFWSACCLRLCCRL